MTATCGHPCDLASARWRLHARAAVLRDLRSRQRISPQRCAAELARLRDGLTRARVAAAETTHAC